MMHWDTRYRLTVMLHYSRIQLRCLHRRSWATRRAIFASFAARTSGYAFAHSVTAACMSLNPQAHNS